MITEMQDSLPVFNIVDIVAIAVIVLGALNGLRRKLSGELAATVGAVLALFFGLRAYHPVGEYIAGHTRLADQPAVAFALTFIVTVVTTIIVMVLVRQMLKSVITVAVHNKKVDRIGGLFAGFVKSCILTAIVILAFNMWSHPYLNRVFGEESAIGRLVLRVTPELWERLQEVTESKDQDAEE